MHITDYVATRLTSRALDIQIEFGHPEALTLSKVEPDRLRVAFTLAEVFMGKNDFSQLEEEIIHFIQIEPQMTKDEQD